MLRRPSRVYFLFFYLCTGHVPNPTQVTPRSSLGFLPKVPKDLYFKFTISKYKKTNRLSFHPCLISFLFVVLWGVTLKSPQSSLSWKFRLNHVLFLSRRCTHKCSTLPVTKIFPSKRMREEILRSSSRFCYEVIGPSLSLSSPSSTEYKGILLSNFYKRLIRIHKIISCRCKNLLDKWYTLSFCTLSFIVLCLFGWLLHQYF